MNSRNPLFIILFFVLISIGGRKASAANFTSNGSGSWTTGSNWGGGVAPPVSGSAGNITINHDLTITGAYDYQGGTMTINAGHILKITSDLTMSNGATINVSGTLLIGGNVTLNANLNILPGGSVIVTGDVTVVSNQYLTIGNGTPPGSYADMTIKGNLMLTGGKVGIDKNGRLAVAKNITSNTWGGAKIDIKSGGQVYVKGNVTLNGGGDAVANANGTTPLGFYMDGTPTTNGGGSSISTNRGTITTMQTNDNPFYQWVNGVLPISLVAFKINDLEGNIISLTWSTASEENFDKFLIEHSSNGASFQFIGAVNGAGNSKLLLNYSFADNSPIIGKNYYRLKCVDLDGKFTYSEVISVNLEIAKEMVVYPNPSNGTSVSFKTNFNPEEDDVLAIFDISGDEITSQSVVESNGLVMFNTTLQPGLYIAKYSSAGFQKVQRLIVK